MSWGRSAGPGETEHAAPQKSLGLQWKLAALYLAVSLLSCLMMAAGYYIGVALGLAPGSAALVGLGLGLVAGLAGSVVGFQQARSIKLLLWEAGDLAGRIARGEFGARMEICSSDEIGVLGQQLNEMSGHLETAVNDLRRLAEQNRSLAEEAGRGAALEERARLARDLHDTVNQQLFVLAMRTAAARRRLEKIGGEAASLGPELASLEELARQAHGEARKLILQIRPTTLDQQGLGAALAEYIRTAAAKDDWQVEADIDEAVALKGRVAEHLFRVAQEALNNISKHASARTVWIRLAIEAEEVQLSIRDDGRGFDLKAGVRPTAVGLIGMQERVESMGGLLRVTSTPGKGTAIVVSVPVGAEGGTES